MNRLSLQAKVTKTGTFTGTGVDTSALVGDWAIILDVLAISGTVRFDFEQSADSFSTVLAGPTVSLTGGAGSGPRRFTFEQRDFPSSQIGIANVLTRLSITLMSGASVTYQSWVDYGSI
jgi:hypothetical protein